MAAGAKSERLTAKQIVDLARTILVADMETIAEGYLGLDYYHIKNIKDENKGSNEAVNRDIIRTWSNKTPNNQVQILACLLYKASEEGGYVDPIKVEHTLGISREEAILFQQQNEGMKALPPNLAAQMDTAYIEACREGTKKVFNARMILAGYSEAGKTSLATKLLGGKINVDVKKSTEGIALHRIESTFNNKEEQKKGGKWTEKSINTSNLGSIFSHAVWSRAKNMARYGSSPMENEEHDDYYSEAIRQKTDPSDMESGEVLYVQPISGEIINELIDNKDSIVELELEEETTFTLSVWDLGGQQEFISTHHLFLNTEATILIVMDIIKGLHQLIGGNFELGYLNSPAEVLHYWLNLLHSDAAKHNRTPNIAIVLTHTDMIKDTNPKKYIDDYKQKIIQLIEGKPYSEYIDIGKIYAVSNATGSDSEFEELRDKLLQHLIQQRTWGYDMPLNWLKLKHDIIKKANGKEAQYLHLGEIWELGENLMMDTEKVESFLEKQTTLGDFVYFPEVRDLVIIKPKWLVDKCKDLISTRKFINERELRPSIRESLKKGIIEENDLKQLWDNDGVVFLIRLMEKFDLLVDVSDGSIRKYVIPCMLGSEVHKDVPYKTLVGSFPWFVSKCSKEKNWKLRLDHLSYTHASFDIGENVKLSLSLSMPVHVKTRFAWPESMDPYEQDIIQRETKSTLTRLLKTCQIQTTDDEGDTQLTDSMLLSLAQEFTNRRDLRTLGNKLKLDESKIATALTNHQNDINEAAYGLLKQWRDSKYDVTVAYKEICQALKDAKQTFLISKVLR